MGALIEASKELKGKILMTWTGVVDELTQKLAERLGVTQDMVPVVILVDMNEEEEE